MTPLTQGLILLLATAVISGLLVPLVVNRVQTRNQERLKTFEADITRQGKVIEDQVRFIERLADVLWTYELMLIDPLYFGQFHQGQDDSGPYKAAVDKYHANAGDQLSLIRAEIGKAVRLVPHHVWEELKSLYYQQLLPLDSQATRLFLTGPSASNRSDWSALHHRVLVDLAVSLDTTIDHTAEVLALKAM